MISFCTHFTQNLDKIVDVGRKTDVESKWAMLKDFYWKHLMIVYVDGLKGQSDDVKHGGGIEMKMRLRRKEWKQGGSKEPYLAAKWRAESVVHAAKKRVEEERFPNLLTISK